MSTGKAPAFMFYASDFKSDTKVKLMNNTARGIYIMLLCTVWDDGFIPSDLETLARITDEPLKSFKKLWPMVEPCFTPVDGDPTKLVQKRLEKVRAEQQEFRERQSERGRIGAKKRWQTEDDEPIGNDGAGIAEALPKHSQPSMPGDSSPISNLQSLSPSPQQPEAKASSRAVRTRVEAEPVQVVFGDDERDVLRVLGNDAASRRDGLISESLLLEYRRRLGRHLAKHGIDAFRHGLSIAIYAEKGAYYACGVMRKYSPGEAPSRGRSREEITGTVDKPTGNASADSLLARWREYERSQGEIA